MADRYTQMYHVLGVTGNKVRGLSKKAAYL